MDPILQRYRHRTVTFHHGGRALELSLANGLFSRGGVDAGTRLLLSTLVDRRTPEATRVPAASPDDPKRILDLGCGWGPLALALAVEFPKAQITAVDRDLLAVRYTEANAEANGLAHRIDVRPSLAYSSLFGPPDAGSSNADGADDEDTGALAAYPLQPDQAASARPDGFDWIVTNIPAKAGETALLDLLFGAGPLLRPGGQIAVVFVTPLAALMQAHLALVADMAELELEREVARAEHVVWHLRAPRGLPVLRFDLAEEADAEEAIQGPADGLAAYERVDVPDAIPVETPQGPAAVPWVAVHDVDEFSEEDYRSRLIRKVMALVLPPPPEGGETILCTNVRHGMLPRQLLVDRAPARLGLVDRDLLALSVATRNVIAALEADLPPAVVRAPGQAETAFASQLGLALGIDGWRELDEESERSSGPDVPSWVGAVDLVCGVIDHDEGKGGLENLLADAEALLAPTGAVVLGCKSGEIATLVLPAARARGWRTGRLLKRRSFAAQVLRPPKPAR